MVLMNQSDIESKFSAELTRNELYPTEIIGDGKIQRCNAGSKKDKSGWYVLYINNFSSGFYGNGVFADWRGSDKAYWHSHDERDLTKPEREQITQQRKQIENELKEECKKAQKEASNIWRNSVEISENSHPYLKKKQVTSYGLRLCKDKLYINNLVIPLYNEADELSTLQFINDDGDKRFLKGGKKKGCYFIIGSITKEEKIYIVEGYSTGASVYEATGCSVVVGFDVHNLIAVSKVIRSKHPSHEIIICADNDAFRKEGNIGLQKAKETAQLIEAKYAIPTFKDEKTKPTDFNDLMALEGMDVVREQLEKTEFVNEEQNVKSEEIIWDEPEEIETELLDVQEFTLDAMPEDFKEWFKDVAFRMQCPTDFLLVGLLTMLSSLIGTGCAIKPKKKDDWVVVPNLWGAIIARPSIMKKSPALNKVLSPLANLEENATDEFNSEMGCYELDLSLHENDKKQCLNKVKSAKGQSREEMKLKYRKLVEPEKPSLKRYRTSDTTVEKMGELLSENPRGILLFSDELTGLLSSWDKKGHETDRAFYLKAWNGYGNHICDRIGRGTIQIKNPCVAILGGLQPDKLLNYLYQSTNGNNDGLLQRFQLVVYPNEPKTFISSKKTDILPNKEAESKAHNIIKEIANLDFSKLGLNVERGFPCFKFDDEAQEYFYKLDDEIIQKTKDEPNPIIAEHLGKYQNLLASLSLIFHIIEFVEDKTKIQISENTLMLAKYICDYLESHARRVYGLIKNISIKSAEELAGKIKKGNIKNGFTNRELVKKNWRFLNSPELAKKACDELVGLNWLKEETTLPARQQKPKTTYKINPKLIKRDDDIT